MISLITTFTGTDLIIAGLALILTLIISLSFHEMAHAIVAYKNGDDTAKLMGRLTLNPIAHLDPLGLIFCIIFGFGWAKPVPVNPLKFKNYRKGMVWVSVAGVITNYILAFICYMFFSICVKFIATYNAFLSFLEVFFYLMFNLNIMLFVFNLIPLFPLDGFNLVSTLSRTENKFITFARDNGPATLIGVLIADNLLSIMFGISILQTIVNFFSLPITMLWGLIF